MHERHNRPVLRFAAAITPILAAALLGVPAAVSSSAGEARANAVVTYRSGAALRAALKQYPARIVRRLPDVRSVEVRPQQPSEFADGVAKLPGITAVDVPERRFSAAEPGLTAMYSAGVPYQWQYTAARVGSVPEQRSGRRGTAVFRLPPGSYRARATRRGYAQAWLRLRVR